MSIQIIVVLSDLHIGSTVGLWPVNFKTQEGHNIGQNEFQRWLWKCWIDLTLVQLPKYIGNDPYAVVLNGDIIEGIHHRTLQVMTANTTDQTNAAKQVLEPLAKQASRLFMVKGTEVHTKDREISLGEALKAEQDKSTGQHAFDRLSIDVHGCRCVFRHHMTTTARPYLEATAMSTELGSERIAAARVGHIIPKVLGLAHRHLHGVFKDVGGIVCVTAGWQGLTRHGFKVVGHSLPSPSCIVLDWRGKNHGDTPRDEEFIYQAKQSRSISI